MKFPRGTTLYEVSLLAWITIKMKNYLVEDCEITQLVNWLVPHRILTWLRFYILIKKVFTIFNLVNYF